MVESIERSRDPEGVNQAGLRDHNARMILSFIRRHGGTASAELARRSGLSAQTVSIIVRELVASGLLVRGKTVKTKGKVGKPQTLLNLNPTGVLSLGLNIGRRSCELVLVDFNGKRVQEHVTNYPYPTVESVCSFLEESLSKIEASKPRKPLRPIGIGVATPNELWGWLENVGAPKPALDKWRTFNLKETIEERTGLIVEMENDTTSACVAEHLLGRGKEFPDFGYFFVGAFVGGGLVMNDKVVTGQNKKAASFGSLPARDENGKLTQLLNVASLFALERDLLKHEIDPSIIRVQPDDWSEIKNYVEAWADVTARHLALASATVASVVEVQAILIDGAFPPEVRRLLCDLTRKHLKGLNLTGISKPSIEEASVGRTARSIGAALLPIHSRYFLT